MRLEKKINLIIFLIEGRLLSFRFNQNFGVLGILDRLHGTDGAFRRSKSFDRHFMIFGLSSARELVPDENPCFGCGNGAGGGESCVERESD